MEHKTGRNHWDLISELPKWLKLLLIFIIIILPISLVIILYISKDLSLKIGSVEIKKHATDTIYKYKTDTIKIASPIPINKLKNTPKKKIEIKHGDTTVKIENQPANVNIGGTQTVVKGNNNGIIGNIGSITLYDIFTVKNEGEVQRHLNDSDKKYLLQIISDDLKKNNKPKDYCIEVSAIMGNSECYNFAIEIVAFLKQSKYNVDDFIGQESAPRKKVQIGFSDDKYDSKCLLIGVGYK